MERTRARGRSSSIIHLVMKLMIENRKAFHHLLAANATMTNLSDRLQKLANHNLIETWMKIVKIVLSLHVAVLLPHQPFPRPCILSSAGG